MKHRATARQFHHATTPVDDDSLWVAFLTARSADQYCHAWLALVCQDAPSVKLATVMTESADGHTFVPIAVWPKANPEFSRLGPAIERVLGERKGIVQPAGIEGRTATHIAYPVFVEDRLAAVIALETDCPESEIQKSLRLIHWGSAWLSNLLMGRELELASKGRERVGSVLDIVAVALRHKNLRQSLFDVVNELRSRLDCDRVAIGLAEHGHIKLTALSEAASFENNTSIVKAYTAAMEEAYDIGHLVQESTQPPVAEQEGKEILLRHQSLLSVSGARHVVSVPLVQGAECLGVLTVERGNEAGFERTDGEWLEALAAMLAPVIHQRRAAERTSVGRLKHETAKCLERLFGPGHLVIKTAVCTTLLVAAIIALVHIDYRVPAKTVIEGEVQRVAAAPFEGFIAAAYARAGDTVRQGQPLAQLDDRELKIERARWASESDQYQNKLREAMANHDLTAVEITSAQLKQAEAQLALVVDKIQRARLVAPFDGIVVTGDLSQQIGSPVESGKKLFEIAPLSSYRVILQVDEREIRHIQPGQSGKLVITGIVGDPMPLSVVKVTPVATAQDGKNFFRVEARLSDASPRLRPGMEGIGKIEVGSHSLWWILTHSLTDWLRLSLWSWLP